MENTNPSPTPRSRTLSLRAKLVLGFTVLSAIVSALTARGIYTNLQDQVAAELRSEILEQSVLVFMVALGLGIFFGLVAGNTLTEPIIRLMKGASDFTSGHLDQNVEITTNDEIGDLTRTFNEMAGEIKGMINNLEQRVAERTKDLENRTQDLEIANKKVQTRASQFEAIAQVTQSITSIRDLQELLPHIATVISDKFGFYHVGVFMLDEAGDYAILSATNSSGGQKMMARRHRLRVGEQGIVGYVTATGNPRIAMDVGKDATFFDNPELPETHSEMALPLTSGNRIIGALDVQSTERGAFTDDDVQMLGLLANQVSLAIENARLFDETRRALAEAEAVSRQSTREAWNKLPTEQKLVGYRYASTGSAPLDNPLKLTGSGTDTSQVKQTETNQIIVPIELRGETIGTLVVQSPANATVNQDQIDLIKAVAERVAISAENARLFDETTRRAERERLVSDITGKIRSVNDPQSMIQTAMEELRKALGANRVEIVPQSVKGAK